MLRGAVLQFYKASAHDTKTTATENIGCNDHRRLLTNYETT